MVLLKTLCSYRFYTFLRQQNTLTLVRSPSYNSTISCFVVNSFLSSSIYQRTFSDIAQLVSADFVEERTENESIDSDNSEKSIKTVKKKKKSLGVKELKEGEHPSDLNLEEINDLKENLGKLEGEVKSLKRNVKGTEEEKEKTSTKGVPTVQSKLYSLFASNPKSLNSVSVTTSNGNKNSPVSKRQRASRSLKEDESINNEISLSASKPKRLNSVSVKNSNETKKSPVSKREKASRSVKSKPLKEDNRPINKEISPEMVSLVSRWYVEGYLNNANFLLPEKFDINCFSNNYSLDFLRFTAERFGQDHQDIAKWLSGADLKRVALFGCPSVERKTVFSAKRLRSFFSIQEDTVCRVCKLKSSCKFVNQKVWQKVDTLNLTDVMRVLILYDLDSGPPQLETPYEMKASISKVLKEVVNLSQ